MRRSAWRERWLAVWLCSALRRWVVAERDLVDGLLERKLDSTSRSVCVAERPGGSRRGLVMKTEPPGSIQSERLEVREEGGGGIGGSR